MDEKISKKHPNLARILPVISIALGLTFVIFGMCLYGNYKEIYDYEATNLFGKATTGKKVRMILSAFGMVGITLTVCGVVLFTFFPV